MSSIPFDRAPAVTAAGPVGSSAIDPESVDAARRAAAPRALATLLLAAGVAALAVVTDRLIETWTDGHLLAAWVLMWAVLFLGSVVLASPARHAAQRVMSGLNAWARHRAQARANARTRALARADARLQAELAALSQRAASADEAWREALAPLGPDLTVATALRAWAVQSSSATSVAFPHEQHYRLYYI